MGGLQFVIADISASFGMQAMGIGILVSVPHIISLFLPILVGAISDRFGKKKMLLLFAGMAVPMVPQGWVSSLLSFFAITTHCAGFSYGVFDLVQVVYFLSITALFLYLSIFVLEYRRLS